MNACNRPKVMVISSRHPWDDPRIFFREAKTLSGQYDVEVHAVADFNEGYFDNVKIVGLPARPHWTPAMGYLILGWRAWRSSAKVVHFHDPELLPLAMVLRYLGKRVIYDMHEDVYEDILEKKWIPRILRPLIARVYLLFQKLGDRVLSGIITVSDQHARYFCNRHLTIVKNYPPPEVFSISGIDSKSFRSSDVLKLIYVGTLNRTRGILQMLRSLEHLPESFSYHLDIVGEFNREKDFESEVRSVTEALGDNVRFHGRLSFPAAVQMTEKSHVGLVCTQPTANDMTTTSLKLFEYMAAGVGIVVPNFPIWQKYTELYPPHVLVDSTDPEDIARGIIDLADALPRFEGSWKKARLNILRRYNWDTQGENLLNLYELLLPTERPA